MTNETILAIDLGKFKSVACVSPRQGGAPAFDTARGAGEHYFILPTPLQLGRRGSWQKEKRLKKKRE